jgi:hypothetical protein
MSNEAERPVFGASRHEVKRCVRCGRDSGSVYLCEPCETATIAAFDAVDDWEIDAEREERMGETS